MSSLPYEDLGTQGGYTCKSCKFNTDIKKGNYANTMKEHLENKHCLTIEGRPIKLEKKPLLEIIPEDTTFFRDQYGAGFARVKVKNHWEVHPVNGREFKRVMVNWLVEAGESITKDKIGNLHSICDGKCLQGERIPLYNRVAKSADGSFWIDLGNEKWEAIRITKDGWQIVSETPLIFRRYSHMQENCVAQFGRKDDLDAFVGTLNLQSDRDRILYAVYLATSFIPGIPHPIICPVGAQGAAKSSFCEATRRLIDNSEILLLSIPSDKNEMAQQLMHHYFPIYDNVHELHQWQSDMLCRAVTGEGFSKRELYSDDGDIIYKYMRVVAVNGINTPGTAPDFLDRCILFYLERIHKTQRKRKEELMRVQGELLPKVLAYLLDCIVIALNKQGEVPDTNHPRMADFAWWGEAISRAMGYAPNEFLAAYSENTERQTREAIEGNLLGDLVLKFVERNENWHGTPTELYANLEMLAGELRINVRDRAFPKNANALMRKLNVLRATLAELGIHYEKTHSGKNIVVLRNGTEISSEASTASANEIKKLDAFLPKDDTNAVQSQVPLEGGSG